MRALVAVLFALAALAFVRASDAHGMRSIYVEILEQPDGRALVTTRAMVPVSGARVVAEGACALVDIDPETHGAQLLECEGGVAGAELRVDGLGAIVSEAVVWIALADGTTRTELATPSDPSWRLPTKDASWWPTVREYAALGVRHIAGGADHLLFLLGLVLVLRRVRAVLYAETAFTLSHSLTFSASALGWVRVSSPAAEACIALSLVLVALDVAAPRAGATTLAASARERRVARRGALLAFVFGLVHGLGFAGGLREIGLPARAIPAALAGFACGVELGQLAFLALALVVFAIARRVRVDRQLAFASTYAVGAVGCFWLVARLVALFAPSF